MTSARGEERTIIERGDHLADSILKKADIDHTGSGEADLQCLKLGGSRLGGQDLVVPDQRADCCRRTVAKTA
jgi:hypothetical protein